MIIFHVFKNLSRDMEDIKTQIKLLEMAMAMSELKNPPYTVNSKLDMAKEKISELEDIAIEIKMK